MFESDPNVLFLSVHRFDHGSFFPGTGNPASVGTCEAPGATVNVGFSSHEDVPMADEDYMAAFRAVVLPFCQHFNPDMVIVSAGFDAARGHAGKLGGYIISPECECNLIYCSVTKLEQRSNYPWVVADITVIDISCIV